MHDVRSYAFGLASDEYDLPVWEVLHDRADGITQLVGRLVVVLQEIDDIMLHAYVPPILLWL